jgi:hypothetical protein
MPDPIARGGVSVSARPLWRIRLAHETPRYLLQALALVGLLASARFAIAPPRPAVAARAPASANAIDRAAEGFASLFARRYLTWNAREPEAQRLSLEPFVGSSLEPGAGLQPPESGAQNVQWTQVVQARAAGAGEHVYTIAVQTDAAGLLYLSVETIREADGGLALAGYPAFVGPPASSAAPAEPHLREVEDPALVTVATRALRNYLARAESELAADLAPGARVSLPAMALALQSVESLDWTAAGSALLAIVRARDAHGVQYTLGYELDVVESAGRWELTAIQVNPDG